MQPIHNAVLAAAGIALVLLGVGSLRPASAQLLQTAYDFQTVQPHPSVHALGNATVAVRGYPGAIGVNPATIGAEEAVRVGSNINLSRGPAYSSPWFRSGFWIAAPTATMKRGPWAGGVQVKHFSRGTTEIRNAQGERVFFGSAFEQSIKLTGAYDVTSSVTVGGGVNLIRSRGVYGDGENVETHPTADLGVQYHTQSEQGSVTLRPSLGLSLTDFGGTVSVENRPGDLAAPTTIRGGGALQISSQSRQFGRPEWRVGLYGALSNRLVSGEFVEENGEEYFEADGPFKALFAGWGSTTGVFRSRGEQAEVSPWERITKHAGLELSILDLLSVRLGRFHESDDNGGRQYTALGIGVDAYYVSLDASWDFRDGPVDRLSYGRLTVRIPLSDSPRNFWPALLGGVD
ncbi:MAG: hypothetical protein V5A58_00570 [Salinibacter sp.]|uniref:hypothetical protein n=1 Tax=Salinibacter sp. TaxID=2065818 RepID=UPI002FC2E8FC